MKKKRFTWLCIAVFMVFWGCKNDMSVIKTTEFVEKLKVTDNLATSIVDTIVFISIKEKENFLFTNIDKIIVKGNRIYIMDRLGSKSLLCFSETGDFIMKIGNIGQGPGEYIRLWDFDVTDDTIYMYDRNQKKMLQFDLEGKFVREEKTPFRATSFKVLSNGSFLFSMVKEKDTSPLLVKTNKNFQNIETILRYSKSYVDDKGTNNIFQNYKDGIIFNKAVNDSVYFFNKEGKLQLVYLFDFGKKTVPLELKNSYEKLSTARDSEEYAYLMEAPMFIDDRYFVGEMFYKKNKATLIYDLKKNKSGVSQWLPEKVHLKDIVLPVASFENTIVGWMDHEIYENLSDKPIFSKDFVKHLEEGGKILMFYHVRK